jgi:hypothetical protein
MPRGATVVSAAVACLVAGGGVACKKDKARLLESLTEEKGKLRRISENLEEAYASAPLPPLTEPVSLAERVEKWDDFRSCSVRTYVARKRDADRRQREGRERRMRHASIGDETVEECAIQLAVAKKDDKICDRLAVDYMGPNGEWPLAAVRCWDTRARVFGLPDECPVIWLGSGQLGRNPECLALARRDASLCPFADSPGRCRALLTDDAAQCGGAEGAPDCTLALDYWRGLIPAGFGPQLIDGAALADKPLVAAFDLKWPKSEHPHIRVAAPKYATALSWPAGKTKVNFPGESEKFWGFTPPAAAVQVTWNVGAPALKLAFLPAGASSGVRPLQPPSDTAPATLIAVWTDDPNHFLRCQPGSQTTGEVRYDAGAAQPGAIVEGHVNARRLACTDGSEVDVQGTFRAVILDLR